MDEPAHNGSEISQYLLEEDNTASKGKGFHTVYGGTEKCMLFKILLRLENLSGIVYELIMPRDVAFSARLLNFYLNQPFLLRHPDFPLFRTATSITIVWKSSINSRKVLPVNSYVVQQRMSSSQSSAWLDCRTVDSNTFQVVVEKLPVNTAYEFMVFASNSSGMSEGALIATKTDVRCPWSSSVPSCH